eukprot:64221_1
MSLSSNAKQQAQQPLFYKDEFDDKDLKVRLGTKQAAADLEVSLADLLISGFIRRHVPNIDDVPLLIVSIAAKMLNKSPHLPKIMESLIPMYKIFNKEVMDLKTPKFSDLSHASRTVLRLFLQWRLNTWSGVIGSPGANLSAIILSGNTEHFAYDGCFFLKQVLPYHPEIMHLLIDNNHIDDEGLVLIIDSLTIRHDHAKIRSLYPIKLLETINLANNRFSDAHVAELLQSLLIYTPYLKEIDLSCNNLTDSCCSAICGYLDQIDEKPKKERYLRKIILRHNFIGFDGVKELNSSVVCCHDSWHFKIELGSNPTEQPYAFDPDQKEVIDHRINLHGA